MTTRTRIYLAGKIDKNDWRHDVVPGLHGATYYESDRHYDLPTWPTLPINDHYAYVGPYMTADDHGCAHGSSMHGNGTDSCCIAPDSPTAMRRIIKGRCIQAIRDCDLFFAWLGHDDALSAYGTLSEIGYAAALDKRIVIGTNCAARYCTCPQDNLWFAKLFARDEALIHADSAPAALEHVFNGRVPV
ncbi:hypothetical protein ACFUEJ_14990 [Gordonia sp. NPDC057258]|uniref:hypothetical protein n=1 Tax=unclassified Gordonia (in: high G+C Gram-positive bacteria) TaxID=2657482 RepID=UPI0036319711